MTFGPSIEDHDGLRTVYRQPSGGALDKEIDHLDEGARSFIARSPFLVLATSSPAGTDASPRGGPPGFVAVLDDHRLALGDLSGNNRLDSYSNVVENPEVGLLFLVPGVDETLRVNGRAALTTDPAVLDATTIDGRRPKVALGVEVDACYIHCAKAFRRARLWDAGSWLDPDERPQPVCILTGHLDIDVPPDVVAANLEKNYTETIWEPGG
jgi:uncharacterized protein